jgi:sugar phosphate isomerase/epimerase
MPALEAGAALGASTFSVVGVDPDRARLTATLARLAAAAPYGVRPTLEPISYQPVSRVADAAAVARAAGAAVLLDALHIRRGGSTLDDVRALESSLVPCIQLCDGPLATPETLELPAALPLGMTADGSVLQVEARALRQVPGEGEFPLAELLAAVPAGTPISVEVPNAGLQAQLSPVEFAARNLRGVQALETRRVA